MDKLSASGLTYTVSAKKIADSLVSFGRKTTSATIENYITALTESFVLYKAGRYDVKGKQHLKSLEKYYVVDTGLRTLLLGNKNSDIGHILENIVYLELIRRGYSVSIGKVGELEIAFIAEKSGAKVYYQVSASVLDPATFEREITPLRRVQDNYPKFIITMDEISSDNEGIRQVNVVDFLLIAFSIFVFVRFVNKVSEKMKKEEAAPAPEEPKGPTQEELHAEIRDLLKAQK